MAKSTKAQKRGPSRGQKFFQLLSKESQGYKRLWIASHYYNMSMVSILNQAISQIFLSILQEEKTKEGRKRFEALCVLNDLDPEKELELLNGTHNGDSDGETGSDSGKADQDRP